MNLRKLSPSMLLALGLACGDDDGTSSDTRVDACLSPPPETITGPCLSTTGPCLGMLPTTADDGVTGTDSGSSGATTEMGMTTGPCLRPPLETETDTDGSGSTTGGDSGTGGALDQAPAETRADALRRVLERGSLPADVAARLRGKD